MHDQLLTWWNFVDIHFSRKSQMGRYTSLLHFYKLCKLAELFAGKQQTRFISCMYLHQHTFQHESCLNKRCIAYRPIMAHLFDSDLLVAGFPSPYITFPNNAEQLQQSGFRLISAATPSAVTFQSRFRVSPMISGSWVHGGGVVPVGILNFTFVCMTLRC